MGSDRRVSDATLGRGWWWLLAIAPMVCRLLPSTAAPQQEPSTPTIKVEARQVVVPVVVTDNKGHHVIGLKASDFRVYEEGAEQQIAAFGSELSGTLTPPGKPASTEPFLNQEAAPPPTSAPATIARTYLVVLDTLFMSFESTARVREAVKKLFMQERGTDSHYALVALGRSLRIVHSVTPKPEEVLAAAESDALPRAMRESGGGNLAGQERQLQSMLDEYCRQCSCVSGPSAGKLPAEKTFDMCSGLQDNLEHWAASASRERAVATRNFLLHLADITRKLGTQPGKRTLVLVSDGFDLWPGRDLYTMIGVYTDRPSFPMRNPAERLGHDLDELVRATSEANVVVYTVDARGLPVSRLSSASDQWGGLTGPKFLEATMQMSRIENARQDTMARLADVTGGVFFRGNNDLAKGIRQAFADEREYYVLAYSPSNREADGKFRKIRVELKDKKLKVRAKQGYWAPAPPSKP